MTTIDGARMPGSIPNVPGATLELLELESVRTGRSRGELVALAVAAMFAPPIEDPAPLGEAPGQGTTRPPAPTVAPKVLAPATNDHLGWTCTTGDEACWKTDGSARWIIDYEDGAACCDDHIPDGWVRPVPEHVHLDGGPCVFGDRCGE